LNGLPDGEFESAAAMAAGLASGEASIEENLARTKRRLMDWEPVINAFTQLSPWVAANEMDTRTLFASNVDGREQRMGDVATLPPDRPWAFVPIAVKDLFDVVADRGVHGDRMDTSGCCTAYQGSVPSDAGPVIDRIARAGLPISGKTNQHELAAGGTNLVSACGRTCNPWGPARMTGGSSGGSAAAVATGIVPWSLGSDTGGSIRIPASMCGIYGLKPTTGQLPTNGMMPLAPSMDCPGPMATTTQDLWMLYRVLRGADPLEPLPQERAEPFRIGLPDGFFADLVHDETRAAVRHVAEELIGAGATVEPVDGRGIEDARRVWMRVCTPEFADALPDWRNRRDRIAPSVLEWLEMGDAMSADDREAAVTRRGEIREWFESRLEGFDALLVPTTAYPAPRADQDEVDLGAAGTVKVAEVGPGYMTCSVNLAGLPAMNVPAGWSSERMPIGVSLIGRRDAESTLFAIAALWEAASGYRPVRPTLPKAGVAR
jgi:aspartyl-tRNA(Asn)/glutamyl-tRNA(Gln) amidotransferase subunit A